MISTEADHSSFRCPDCGALLTGGEAGGLCVSCLLGDAVAPAHGATPLGSIGGYDLVEVIARGGMGIVYRARHDHPERNVALKALPGAALLSEDARQRFKIEAQAMARLEHPAILPVYELGEDSGTPFFTMKLVAGGTLSQHLARYKGQWREIAELMVKIAEAVQFAHERGVLHRDLKPGNILFDESGKPFVSDFGLAKILDHDVSITRNLEFIGTPDYMAPELLTEGAAGSTIACDVWSLGVILWDLLGARPAFEHSHLTVTLRAVDHAPPKRLPSDVPRDLGAIASKALQIEPSRRYASARQLADDLLRWLEGKPVQARAITIAERVWLWVRRNRTKAAMILIAAGSALIALLVSIRAHHATQEAVRLTMIHEAGYKTRSGKAGQRHESLEMLKRAAAIRQDAGLVNECAAALALPDVRFTLAWNLKNLMMAHRPEVSPNAALCATIRPAGGFLLCSTVDGAVVNECLASAPARSFAFAADNKSLAVRLANHRVQIWKTDGLAPLVDMAIRGERNMDMATQASFSANLNAWVVTCEDGSLAKITLDGVTVRFALPTPMKPGNLLFDPKGEKLALVTNNLIEVWKVVGEPQRTWSAPIITLQDVLDWSPDGRLLAYTTSRNIRGISIVDPVAGIIFSTLPVTMQVPERIAFHPREPLIASTARDSVLRIWDYRDGRKLLEAPAAATTLTWSPDGKRLWCGLGESDFGGYELTQSTTLREFTGPPLFGQDNASDFLVSGDQRLLMSANGKRLRFWHPELRRFLGEITSTEFSMERAFLAHDSSYCVYAIKGDKKCLARHQLTLSEDGTRLNIGPRETVPGSGDYAVLSLPADGSWVVWNDQTKAISQWAQGDPLQTRLLIPSTSANTKFSPDLRQAVSVDTDQDNVDVRDLTTSAPPRTIRLKGATSIRWSQDGSVVFVHGAEENLLLEAGTWSERARWKADDDVHGRKCIALSGDSHWLSYSISNESLQLVDLLTHRPPVKLRAPEGLGFRRAIFSRDGRHLWTMGVAGRVFEWDLEALSAELKPLGVYWP